MLNIIKTNVVLMLILFGTDIALADDMQFLKTAKLASEKSNSVLELFKNANLKAKEDINSATLECTSNTKISLAPSFSVASFMPIENIFKKVLGDRIQEQVVTQRQNVKLILEQFTPIPKMTVFILYENMKYLEYYQKIYTEKFDKIDIGFKSEFSELQADLISQKDTLSKALNEFYDICRTGDKLIKKMSGLSDSFNESLKQHKLLTETNIRRLNDRYLQDSLALIGERTYTQYGSTGGEREGEISQDQIDENLRKANELFLLWQEYATKRISTLVTMQNAQNDLEKLNLKRADLAKRYANLSAILNSNIDSLVKYSLLLKKMTADKSAENIKEFQEFLTSKIKE